MEAIKFFKFPYQTGEFINNMYEPYFIKETFDKYYIIDTAEPLSRYEVIYSSAKNSQNIATRVTLDMNRKGTRRLGKNPSDTNSYFGLFLGRVIPILKNPSVIPGDMAERIADNMENEFFESCLEYWMEVLVSKEYEPSYKDRPVWIKFDLTKKLQPVYRDYLEAGGAKSPHYEHKLMCYGSLGYSLGL